MRKSLFFVFLFINLLVVAQTVEDDFEGNGTITSWFGDDCGVDISYSNPFQLASNTSATVLKYIDAGGTYANVRFDVPINFDLSEKHTFSLKIYVSSTEITGSETNKISLKLQNGKLSAPWSTQSEIIKPIVLNQWQTITFDFKNDTYVNLDPNSIEPTQRTDFNRILIQVNGENNASNVTAYIDDFLYDGVLSEDDDDSGTDPVFDNLVWSDEFEGNGALNSAKWFHQTQLPNGDSWYNGEIQHYTNRTDNTYVANGLLTIEAKKETYTNQGVTKNYTSARLNSKFAFKNGRVEIRAKLPTGIGTWPAIWMLGKNIIEPGGYWTNTYGTTSWPACGEVDIMEHWGSNQNYVQSAMHTPSSYGGTVNHGGQTVTTASTEFHVYSLDWSSEKMVFKVDGITHYTYNPEIKNSDTWPFDAEQYLLLNIAIQPSIAANFTSSKMEIDYVRVYQESTASVSSAFLEEIQMYPNPIKDKLTIKIPSLYLGAKAIIYTVTGSKVANFSIDKTTQVIECSNLKKGIYFLKLESNNKVGTFKLIKN
jgi:beta-glucanase (GH16 family)